MKIKVAEVYLNGGIGNQLFQLSSTFRYSPDRIHLIVDKSRDYSEIQQFNLPKNVFVKKLKFSLLKFKIINYLFRRSTIFGTSTKSNYFNMILEFTLSLVISIIRKGSWRVILSRGVGYSEIIPTNARNVIMIGYFQSYKYLEDSKINPKEIFKFGQIPKEVQILGLENISENLLVIHRRMGDYRKNPDFGILDLQYFEKSMKYLMDKYEINEIWYFCNEQDDFEQTFSKILGIKIFPIPERVQNSIHLLYLMSKAKYFICSNSSLSLWGAYLSSAECDRIVAPTKWFKGRQDPKRIVKPGWKLIESTYI